MYISFVGNTAYLTYVCSIRFHLMTARRCAAAVLRKRRANPEPELRRITSEATRFPVLFFMLPFTWHMCPHLLMVAVDTQ